LYVPKKTRGRSGHYPDPWFSAVSTILQESMCF
jgi:hypothetical protein